LDASETEYESIQEWRYGRRDPLRRRSLLDKVQVGVDSMMKKSQGREKPLNEELRALVLGEELVDRVKSSLSPLPRIDSLNGGTEKRHNGDGDILHRVLESKPICVVDNLPRDLSTPLAKDAMPSANAGRISRVSSGGSLVSMGQWMTPEPAEQKIVRSRDDTARRRLPAAPRDDSEIRSLPYGSDHEEDFSNHAGDRLLSPGQTNKISSTAVSEHAVVQAAATGEQIRRHRPPVVFRESWQSKQDRLRSICCRGTISSWQGRKTEQENGVRGRRSTLARTIDLNQVNTNCAN